MTLGRHTGLASRSPGCRGSVAWLPAPLGTRSLRTHPFVPDARQWPGKIPVRTALSPRYLIRMRSTRTASCAVSMTCPQTDVSATATHPHHGANGTDRAATRGTLHPATAAVDELEGQTNWRQARLGVASAGDEPCSKRTTQSGKLSGKRGCRLLITRQAGCCTRPELLAWGEAPRRNRTGDPILTIDAPTVHDAMQHLPYPYKRPGQRQRRDRHREAARGCVWRSFWQISGKGPVAARREVHPHVPGPIRVRATRRWPVVDHGEAAGPGC
jgi:hypothetical protein